MTLNAAPPTGSPGPRRLRIAVAYYAAYLLLGVMLTCIGPSLDALMAQSGSSAQAIALLFTVNSLGYIAGSLLAGRLYGRLAGHRIMAGALLLAALLTVTVPSADSLWQQMAVFALIGVPLGLMDVGGNTLIFWLYRSAVPPYMNALHLSFGVGAFVGPLVIDRVAASTGDALMAFWLFAALMVPVAAWLARLPSPQNQGAARPAPGTSGTLRRHAWLLALVTLFFFMHMGAELAFGGWIFSYANEAIGSETTARVINSLFWAGLVFGRVISVPLAWRLSPQAMLEVDLLGAGASLALIVLLPDWSPALWIGTIGFGVAIASMIPSSFNLAGSRVPITGRVNATFLVGGSIGSMTLPWLIGQLFEPYGRLWVMYVTGAAMVAAAVLLGLILWQGRQYRRLEEAAA